jgi:hypothetical protein
MYVLCPLCRKNVTVKDVIIVDSFQCYICFEMVNEQAELSCNHPDHMCEACIYSIGMQPERTIERERFWAIITSYNIE